MRFSPTKLLQGLLCSTPLLVLTLAACGGGGSSSASLGSAYTLGGAISASASSVGSGLVLRNNGGDDLTVPASAVSFVFATKVLAGKPYTVTVLNQPSSPVQNCAVTNATGTMPAYDLTVPVSGVPTVTCYPAYKIGGTINNTSGSTLEAGLVLQNNGGDNLIIPAGITSGGSAPFNFSTPLVDAANYTVTVLAQPGNQKQTCYVTAGGSGTVAAADVSSVTITCIAYVLPSREDRYVYATNSGSNGTGGITNYFSTSGVLATQTLVNSGSGPNSIAVTGGKYAYVANYGSKTISAYSISAGPSPTAGTLVPIDMGGGINTIATGTGPISIAIHPSGKFAYVANFSSNSISAYSIDPVSGALAGMDADGATSGTQSSIPTRRSPVSIAITPDGNYAYVANASSNNISTYSIDSTSGALTAIDADGLSTGSTDTFIPSGGTAPYSVAVDPTGKYLFTVNSGSNNATRYNINSDGHLDTLGTFLTGAGPHAIAVHPNGIYAYVANTNDNAVEVFNIDSLGALLPGAVVPTGTGSSPYAIAVDSTGLYLYVADSGNGKISAFAISAGGATLTEVLGPFAAGSIPASLATSH